MTASIVDIPTALRIPAGVLGPAEVAVEVRAFLVPHDSGLVLVDTGMEASGEALDLAIADTGATWADVSAVVLTHGHLDHVGALRHVREAAPRARILANPADRIAGTDPLLAGDTVGPLRAIATPGHTAGHLSLIDESRGVLLIGDCLGSVDGVLARAPERFTADPERAELSLHEVLSLRGARMLFAHGAELEQPWEALDLLLAG